MSVYMLCVFMDMWVYAYIIFIYPVYLILASVEDLAVGKEIVVFGRQFLLYDVDPFTKEYYINNLG
jgi:hypothetical protein